MSHAVDVCELLIGFEKLGKQAGQVYDIQATSISESSNSNFEDSVGINGSNCPAISISSTMILDIGILGATAKYR